MTFVDEKLILLRTLDRENLTNGHEVRVVLQCSLRGIQRWKTLKRFTQKVVIVVEDIDDHDLFSSTEAMIIMNGENNTLTKVRMITTGPLQFFQTNFFRTFRSLEPKKLLLHRTMKLI